MRHNASLCGDGLSKGFFKVLFLGKVLQNLSLYGTVETKDKWCDIIEIVLSAVYSTKEVIIIIPPRNEYFQGYTGSSLSVCLCVCLSMRLCVFPSIHVPMYVQNTIYSSWFKSYLPLNFENFVNP